MSVIKSNIRKTSWTDLEKSWKTLRVQTWPISPIFNIRIFLNILKQVSLLRLFNAFHVVKFRNKMSRSKEKFENDYFRAKKNSIYLILGVIRIFLKIRHRYFKPLFKACHQVQFQKNPIYRFSEKFKYWFWGPKMIHLSLVGRNKNIS